MKPSRASARVRFARQSSLKGKVAFRRLLIESLEQRALLATMQWTGAGGNANWSNAANWSFGVAPQSGDSLVFPAGATNFTSHNDLADGTIINTLQITGSGYNISSPLGRSVRLAGGLTANNVTGSNTVALDITLLNAQSFMNANEGSTLNLAGNIDTANIVGNYFIGVSPALVFDGAGTTNATTNIRGSGSVSKLGGGTVILAGNNTFEGITEARQGFIRVTSNTGLGSATTGHTEVQQGAAIEFQGVTLAESFVIREGGVGFSEGTDTTSLGALRAVGGVTSTINNVDIVAANNLIGATAGSRLVIGGRVMNGINTTNRLIKVGPGFLQLAGTEDNVFRGETRVLAGTLELNKTPGKDAIGGDLIIGDNIGGDNAAVVRLLQSNQIPQLNYFDVSLTTITLNSSGSLEFGANSDTIGNLTLTTGATYSADVSTTTGQLTLGGNVTVNAFQGSSGITPAATISGRLDVGSFFSGGAAATGDGLRRNFTVNDTQLNNVAADLVISAVMTGASDVPINKAGGGTLRLTGDNSGLVSPILMNGGIIEVGHNNALGTSLIAFQNNGNVLRAVGGPRTISNDISLDGNLAFLGDDLTLSGNVTLTGGRTLFTTDPAQTVTISGVIGESIFGSQPLNKSGRGTLALTAANTFSGALNVNNDGGTLTLSGAGTVLNATSILVGTAATLRIDNNQGTNLTDRINDATGFTTRGRILFVGSSTAHSSELLGAIAPDTTQPTIIEVENTSGGSFTSTLTGATLTVGGDRPTRFVGTGVALSDTGPSRISFVNNPGGLTNGILPQAIVTGPGGALDFATFGSSAEGIAIIPLPDDAYVTDIAQASPTSNVKLSANATLTANKAINALLLAPGVTLGGTNAALSLTSGNMIFEGSGTINVGILNSGNGEIYIPSGATATIHSDIYSGSIQKNGGGKLILTGDNHYTGSTIVNEGVLNIQRSTALGGPTGTTTVRANASIELEQTTFGPIVVDLEPITVEGTGGLDNRGALRNIAGNNSWAANVTLVGNAVSLLDMYDGYPVVTANSSFVDVANGTTLKLTGDFGGADDLGKLGGGTLELNGVVQRGQDRNNRIFAGTLVLNNVDGGQVSRGRYFVGTDIVGAPTATLRWTASDQVQDDRGVTVMSSGVLELNGNNELIAETNLNIHVTPAGAGQVSIGTGGTLTINAGIQVLTQGVNNPTGATITGGTLALHQYGIIGGNTARTFQVNDGAVGDDLTITSTIVDGTGLQSFGITKTGFGTLVLGGTTANTFTGDTTINEGTIVFDKGTGTGGVNAIAGRLFIGNNDVTSGFASSDVARWNQPNQLPDYLALVEVRSTGLLDLNGFNETIGVADAQNALSLQASSTVDLGGGTLILIGNLGSTSSTGAGLWTVRAAPRVINGTLDLGALNRAIDVGGDVAEIPYELEISANIIGTAGFMLNNAANNTGTLLLSGDNSGLSGDVVRSNGNFAIASDTAFGTGRALITGHITTYGGKRTIATTMHFAATTGFIAGYNTAGVGAIGGGGNDLVFTGAVNVAAGTWQPSVPIAGQVEFAGTMGEMYGAATARKLGFGTMIITGHSALSGLEVGQDTGNAPAFTRLNGGHVVIRDNGTWLNASPLIGAGGVLQIDNSGIVVANRLADGFQIDLAGGTLALVGKPGAAVTETFGQIRLRNNATADYVQSLVSASGGSSATWRFANMVLESANNGSSIEFTGRGVDLSDTGANRIAFNTMPTLLNSIVPYGVLQGSGGLDFVTVVNNTPTTAPFDNFLTALTSGPNFATTLAGATNTTNVKLATSESVAGALTVGALLLPTGGLTVDGGGTLTVNSGLLISAAGTNTVSVASLVLDTAEGIVYTDSGTLNLASSITGGATTSLAYAGNGLTIVTGNNTYTGTTRVTSGTVRLASDSALGTTAAGTNVSYGGVLELLGVTIPNGESLVLGGFGEQNLAAVSLRALTDSTWAGNISLNHNRTAIYVEMGARLIVGGAGGTGIVSNQGMAKVGHGTLQLAGSGANTFVQDNQSLIIFQGTVELNKTPGVNALRAAGTNVLISVGDNVGGPNADQLVFLNSNQLPDANTVTVTSTGRMDLGAFDETITSFALHAGMLASGTITSTTGTLTISGNSTIDPMSGGGSSYGPATFAARLGLAGTAPRILTVNDTSSEVDVDFSGTLSGVNFQKEGPGRLLLSGDNSAYAGTITLNGGETVINNPNALGNATGSTSINDNFTLLIDGSFTLAEPIARLGTAGFGSQGALRQVAGSSILTGSIVLAGTATISVNGGSVLDVRSAISGGTNGVTKLMDGTLVYSGTAANTYTGTTSVFQGTLELNKTGVNAIAGVLTIGNDNGSQDSDAVRLLQPNQIADTVQVQVTPSGLLDLNGNNELIGNNTATGLNLFVGGMNYPNIRTGAGTLTLGNGLGIQAQLATGGVATIQSPGANISGNLSLGGFAHAVNAIDSGLNIRELQIDANIVGGGAGGSLTSSGTGLLVLNGNNSGITANTTISGGGGIVVGSATALGAGTLNITGNSNLFTSTYGAVLGTLTIANPVVLTANLTLRGDRNLILSGPITNSGGDRTLTSNVHAASTVELAGQINLSNDNTNRIFTITNSTFGGGIRNNIFGGDVTISGAIVDGGTSISALSKGGNGLVTLTNNANSYRGTTTVSAGNLRVTANNALGSSFAEQQTFTVSTTAGGGGSFTLTFGQLVTRTTTALSYTGTTAPSNTDVTNALMALPNIGDMGGVITVTSTTAGLATTYTVTFGGTLSGLDVPTMTAAAVANASITTAPATTAAGQGTGGTTVAAGATIQIEPGLTIGEPIRASGLGVATLGGIRLRDVTPGVTETTTIVGYTSLDQQGTVGIDAGGASADRLIMSGGVLSGNQAAKVGAGEWELSGIADNGLNPNSAINTNGWDDGLDLRAGTVILNKPGVSRGFSGTSVIGDGGGGDNADRLILLGSGTDQIGGNSNLTVAASALISFAGSTVSESIGSLTLQRIGEIAGDVAIGTGTLIMNGDVLVTNAGPTTGATEAATISGQLNLNGNRNFTISDSFALHAAEDLVVSAVISNGALTSNGYGTLALTAANTYGATNVNSQTLDLNQQFTHGLRTAVGGTVVVRGAGTLGTGTVTVNTGGTLTLDNTTASANRIPDAANLTIVAGRLNLIGNIAGTTETVNTLTINAGENAGQAARIHIDATHGLTELAAASLARGASASAEFIATGDDLGETTDARIRIAAGTNPFVNGVVPWATMTGPAGYDLVTDADGNSGAGPFSLGRVTTYNSSVNAGGIVRLSGVVDTLTADRTIDALLLENGATVTGGFQLTIGTGTSPASIVSRGGNNALTNGAAGSRGVDFANREVVFLVDSNASLEISGNVQAGGTLRKERGGNLILSGDNNEPSGQITGAMVVNAGTLTVRHSDALGTTAGSLTVQRRAAVVFDSSAAPIALGGTVVTLNGLGLNDDGSGALITTGTNPVSIGNGTSAVTYNTAPTIVTVGATAPLTFDANVSGGNALIKRGAGDLIYTGTTGNSATGTVAVNAGRLVLDKSGGVIAVNGALTIDDLSNYDDLGAGTVIYTGNSTNMVGDVAITVNHQGTFDFNGKTDTTTGTVTINGGRFINTLGGGSFQANALTMTGGVVDSGSGTFILNGNLTYSSGLSTLGSATIEGNLNLLGGTRTFTINLGYRPVDDLAINAAISNGRVIKNGTGALLLSNGNNSFLPEMNEVQTITIPATVTSLTLSFNAFGGNLTTVAIPFSASTPASIIQAALESLPNIQPGNVAVTGPAGGPFTVTFQGVLAGIDVNQLTSAVGSGTGTITHATTTIGVTTFNLNAGILSLAHDTALGSTRLTATGNPTQILPIGNRIIANPLTIYPNQNFILGGRRDITGTSSLTFTGPVSLGTPGTAQDLNLQVDDPLTNVTFAGPISGGNSTGFLRLQKTGIGTLTFAGANSFLAPVNVAAGVLKVQHSDGLGARVDEVQFVRDTGSAFTLTFNGFTTASIPTGSSAATVAAALNALPSIGGSNGSVTVTGTGVMNATTFDPFRIRFEGFLSGTDVAAMTASGATVLAITANGGGTTVVSGAQLQLDGSLAIGNEALTYTGIGLLARTGIASGFTGAIQQIAGSSTWGTDSTPIQNGGGNGQTNYIGVNTGASLVFDGTVYQPGLAAGQFTNLSKVGGGSLELAGTVGNSYGTLAILDGTVILNKAPGVNASGFYLGAAGTVVVGDNVGAADSDILILASAEQIPDAAPLTVVGTGQVRTNAAQAAAITNEVQQIAIGNAAPSGNYRLQFNGATTGDIAFGASFAVIQAALNNLSTIGGAGGRVYVTGSGTGQNQSYTVTFLGSLAGMNLPQLKVMNGGTAFTGAALAVTTLTNGGQSGRETVGAITLRMAPQGTGNIQLDGGSTLSLNGDVTIDNYGALPASATSGAVIAGGTLELQRQSAAAAATNRNFNVTADSPADVDLLITSIITDGALGSMSNLVKNTGAGSRMVMTNANTYTGLTSVVTGALQIENAVGLGTTAPSEIQNYVINNVLGAATGQYTLTFDGQSVNVDANATADEVATALNGLSTIGGVGGSVQVVSIASGNTNIQYFIRFGGSLAATDVSAIVLTTGTLAGGATIGAVTVSQNGGAANFAASQTTVGGSGSLELDNVGTINGEFLQLAGIGIINANGAHLMNGADRGQFAVGTGALRSVAGNNTWLGNINIVTNERNLIGVDSDTLTVNGIINSTGGNGHLVKVGLGTLELAGSTSNTLNGNTYLQQGTLLLNKSGTAQAINAGDIYVGDSTGGNNADVLRWATTAGTDQTDRPVRISRSGLLDFNGKTETINSQVSLDVGPTSSANFTTGGGTFLSTNTLLAVSGAGLDINSPAATFSGIYDLGGATRNIDVRDGLAPTELDIQGVIQVTGNFGITKVGQGRLRLSGANTYNGLTTVSFGVLEAANNNALGTTNGSTTVASGATLALYSTTGITVAEDVFVVPNTSFESIQNVLGDNVLSGTVGSVAMINTQFGVRSEADSLTFTKNIGVSGNTLRVSGAGDIIVNGDILGGDTYVPAVNATTGQTGNWHFDETTGTVVSDSSGNGNDGNLVNGPTLAQASQSTALGTAISFNGTNQYITTVLPSALGFNGSFTAMAWVNAASVTGDKTVFGNDAGSTNNGLHLIIRNGKAHFGFFSNDTAGNANLLANTWYHMVWRYDATVGGGTQTIFINGAVDASTGGHAGFTGTATVNIGRWNNGNYFQGLIDEPAVFNRALNDAEITSLYGASLSSSLLKTDTGTLTLNAATNFTGPTNVEGGTLLVNGSTVSNTTVHDTATLGGTGAVNALVTVNSGGTVAPGIAEAGVLTVAAANFNLSGNYVVQLQGSAPGVGAGFYDQLTTSTGQIDLGSATLSASAIGFVPSLNDEFVIVRSTGTGSITGRFAGLLNEGDEVVSLSASIPSFLKPVISYAGGDGDDVSIILVERNIPPTITATNPVVAAIEPTATNSGTFGDLDPGTTVTLTASIGTVTYTPGQSGGWTWSLGGLDGPAIPAGPFSVTITADDNSGRTNAQTSVTFTYTVANANPVAGADSAVVNEQGPPVVISPLGNDSDPAGAADPLTITSVTQGAPGSTVTFTAGTLTYDPGTAFLSLPAGTTTTDTFTYTISDGDGGTATATVTVTISSGKPVFSPPTQSSITVPEGPAPTNTGNYTDPNGDNVTFTATVGGVPFGTVTKTGVGSGTWTWTAPPTDGNATVTVDITGTDTFGGSSVVSFQYTVTNVAPTLTISSPTTTVAEGSVFTLNLSSSDPGVDTITSWTINWGDTIQVVTGNPSSVTHTYADGPANYTITATATDEDGTYAATGAVNVSVTNLPPVPEEVRILVGGQVATPVAGAVTMIPGVPVTFVVSTSDPSFNLLPGNAADAPFTFTIQFGDGNTATATVNLEDEEVSFTHVYGSTGTFQPRLTVTDGDGASNSPPLDLTQVIGVQQALVDGVLFVAGSALADRIIISAGGLGGVIVRINNKALPRQSVHSKIVVYGNAGNDTISVSNLPVPVEFYGGAGDDYLAGGPAPDLLVGGPGRDRLLGGSGNDTLLGGAGNDTISGGLGNDYISGDEDIDLIGGTLLPDGSTTSPGDMYSPALPGNDTLSGDQGNDNVYGGGGNDTMHGGLGHDYLDGGAGGDRMDGGDGNDLLWGNIGSDTLFGRAGIDMLLGGAGGDTLYGGSSTDLMFGSDIDPLLIDDTELRSIWATWQQFNYSAAVEALAAGAVNDSGDILLGEGDDDYYLHFVNDLIKVASERKGGNILRPLP